MTADNEKLNVLIADDEPDIRELIKFEFESEGHTVSCAANGTEAFELIRSGNFDLVITDVRMPGGSGIDLLDNVKKHHPDLPVIFITGYSDISLEDAFDRGVEAVFSKPFSLDNLLQVAIRISTQKTRWVEKPSGISYRRSPRVTVEIEGELKIGGRNVEGSPQVVNIGRGGAFFSLTGQTKTPRVGEEIAFRIPIVFPDGSRSIVEGTGVVRWVREASVDGRPPGCGVEFIQVREEARARLTELINALRIQPFIPKS